MPIVPSGNRRLMKVQQQLAQDTGLGGSSVEQDAVFDDGSQSAPPPFDFQALQQQMQGNDDQPAPSADEIGQAVQDESGGAGLEESLERAVIGELTALGVPEKMFNTKEGLDPFFQWDENLDDGTSSGFYLIPSFTQNQEVTREKAREIAQKIGSQFSLSQKITKEGHNYKVKFQTRVEEPQKAQFGTSFDDLLRPGSTEGMRAAASSRNPIITGSRDETLQRLYEQLKESE